MFSKKDFVRKLELRIRKQEYIHEAVRGSEDPFKGWTELELEAYRRQKPAEVEQSKLVRKMQQIKDRELFKEKRAIADLQTRVLYPESIDPNSQFSKVMQDKMEEYDLKDSPKGRLAAAKLANIELKGEEE